MFSSRTPLLRLPAISLTVWMTAACWVAAVIVALPLAGETGLFDRPGMNNQSLLEQVIAPQFAALEALAVIGLVLWMTRKRPAINAETIAIPRSEALYVLGIAGVYGFIAIIGGLVVGTLLGTHPFSFHLPGTLIGAHLHDLVTPIQTVSWSAYNVVAWVVIPMFYMRNRFPKGRSFLHSTNLRGDLLVVIILLVVESISQVLALSDAVFDLSGRQLAIGMPLSFGIYLLGTGLPTMIFVQTVIVPRLLVVTGSFTTAVVLGGVAYTLVHMPESWMIFSSSSHIMLSIIFLFFIYFFPGMVKATITLRTGNAWTHMWAYHAIAPHVIIDTPLIVAIFAL